MGSTEGTSPTPSSPTWKLSYATSRATCMGINWTSKKEEVRALCMTWLEDLRMYAWERFGGHDGAKFREQLLLCKAARVIKPSFAATFPDANALLDGMQGLRGFKFVTLRTSSPSWGRELSSSTPSSNPCRT